MKKVLFAASECVPFIKTGGLADVCGALPKQFDKEEWDVRVVIPNYSCIPEKYRNQFEYVTHFYMGTGPYVPSKYVGVLKYELDGITYYFIDNQEYFDCFLPYGDIRYDIEKFTFFDKAVLSMLPQIGFQPDLIHCHDWQAGLIPVFLNTERTNFRYAAGTVNMDDIFTFFNTGAQCRMICIIRLSVIFLLESRCNTASVGMSCLLLYLNTPLVVIFLSSIDLFKKSLICLRNIIYAFCFHYEFL
mgnify:CR=1 FL=1